MTGASDANRLLLLSSAVVFLASLTMGMPLPVLPGYVHDTLGFGPVTVGWVIGAQSLATLLSRPLGGAVSDRRGGRAAVILGAAIYALAGTSYAVSSLLAASPGLALGAVFAGRAALGLGESLMITGALAWTIAAVGPAQAGRAMIWCGIAMFAAIAAGAPLGALVFDRFGFLTVGAATIILPCVAAALACAGRPVASAPGKRLPFYRVVGLVLPPGLGLVLSTVGFAALYSFLGLDFSAHGWGGAAIGLSLFGGAFILARLLLGWVPDRVGGAPLALFTLPVQALGQLLVWLAPSPLVALVGAAVTGAGYSLTFPALGIEAVRAAPPQNRGAAMGAYMLFLDIGLAVSGPVAGLVVTRFGFPSAFLLGGAACLAGFAVTCWIVARRRA
jgi:MFS family permease